MYAENSALMVHFPSAKCICPESWIISSDLTLLFCFACLLLTECCVQSMTLASLRWEVDFTWFAINFKQDFCRFLNIPHHLWAFRTYRWSHECQPGASYLHSSHSLVPADPTEAHVCFFGFCGQFRVEGFGADFVGRDPENHEKMLRANFVLPNLGSIIFLMLVSALSSLWGISSNQPSDHLPPPLFVLSRSGRWMLEGFLLGNDSNRETT